jgi:hypothetical protein
MFKRVLSHHKCIIYLFCLVVFVCLCSSTLVIAKSKSFKRYQKRWTRSDEVYQRADFYASIRWAATYMSDEFLRAKAKKLADIYHFDAQKEQELLDEEYKKYGDSHVFFLSFYAYDPKDSNLNRKNSIWDIKLKLNNGKILKPEHIKVIPRISPLHQAIYPQCNVWSKHYFIYFPKTASDSIKNLALEINGPFTHSELKW